MVVIQVNHVKFKYSYSDNYVIKDITWSSHSPQTIGLLGINGSGKTTMLKLLTGIIKPLSGTIIIDNKQITNVKHSKKLVSFVPENAKLFLIGPTLRKDLYQTIKDRKVVDELINKYGLESIADKKLYHLSEGQRRLLAIFSAFQLNRSLIMLDEPTIGLDSNGRSFFLSLAETAKNSGRTVIISTNDSRILPKLDRILVIVDGYIKLDGKPQEVLYQLEKTTSLIPNQIVRVINGLHENNIKISSFVTVEELNEYISNGRNG